MSDIEQLCKEFGNITKEQIQRTYDQYANKDINKTREILRKMISSSLQVTQPPQQPIPVTNQQVKEKKEEHHVEEKKKPVEIQPKQAQPKPEEVKPVKPIQPKPIEPKQ